MGSQLVAREKALQEVHAAVRDGGGVVVSGAAGVGKTALVAAAAERLAGEGTHVVWIVATAASRSMPFGALAMLLPGDLASLHPALVLGAIARHLRDLAGTKPVVIVVDDAHLLDDHSAATVLGLVTSGAARALVTARTGEQAPDAVVALWKDRLLEPIEIGPLDQSETATLLSQHLGGDATPATVEVLWAQTLGNPLYLTEVVRYGQVDGRFVDAGGVWMWRGEMDVPPRLADLMEVRFHGLSDGAHDALGALVLGEPLAHEILLTVAPPEALAELEARGLVEIRRREGRALVHFAHPVLAATAARNLGSIRRRRMAERLVAASGPVDLVRRASWQLDVAGPVDASSLVAGARAVLLSQPTLALRLAERAFAHDPGPDAALALAGAYAELGDVASAKQAQRVAATRVRDDHERLALHLDELALTTFSERRPDVALARLTALRRELPARFAVDLDSTEALLTMFAARPGDALVLAERVLAGDPPQASVLRARTARIGGLAHADRATEAVAASDELLVMVASPSVGPYAQGLADATAAMARLANWVDDRTISTDAMSGRWPVPPPPDAHQRIEAVAWPLIEGARRLLEGHLAEADARLHEAVVQQRAGEGLFRSEAVTLLAVCLAARGATDEAEALLEEVPPDGLAVYPGLGAWAAATLDAARGRPSAVEHAFDAAHEADEAGSLMSTVAYLAEAARMGAATRAELLDNMDHEPVAPVTAARALGIRARATGDGRALLEAAERHVALGMVGPGVELAGLAVAALGRGPVKSRERAQALVTELRRRRREATPATEPVVPLSRRELEVARLAVRGMSDRDIAATLVVSVRTVESHLAACYRKLDISSRQGLRDVLAGVS